MASWARQRQQITEAADGGARARTGADGAVVLNLRRGPGAYALLSRADGQLTRAGQHYYSHLGLRPPSKDFDYNQPLIREGPNDYILLRNGQKKLVRSLQGGEHRLTKLGDKYYEYLVHVPVSAAGGTRPRATSAGAFEDKPLCVFRQLAELLQLSVEEVCADFDAMLRHDWRRLGISAEEVREFCVWRNAPMRVLSSQGDLVDSYEGAPHRVLPGLRRALLHVQGREEGAGAGGARALPGRGEADPAAHPRVQPGLFWCEDLREARRQLMAAGESPKVAMSSPAQYCGLRLRRGTRGGARRSTRSTGASAWPAWRTRFF